MMAQQQSSQSRHTNKFNGNVVPYAFLGHYYFIFTNLNSEITTFSFYQVQRWVTVQQMDLLFSETCVECRQLKTQRQNEIITNVCRRIVRRIMMVFMLSKWSTSQSLQLRIAEDAYRYRIAIGKNLRQVQSNAKHLILTSKTCIFLWTLFNGQNIAKPWQACKYVIPYVMIISERRWIQTQLCECQDSHALIRICDRWRHCGRSAMFTFSRMHAHHQALLPLHTRSRTATLRYAVRWRSLTCVTCTYEHVCAACTVFCLSLSYLHSRVCGYA